MTGYNYVFDATQYAPEQGMGTHPIGKFQAQIANTSIKPTKDNSGGMFVVEFETEGGRIAMRYNLWNQNQKAVDIAHRQLSALSHATGVFRLDMNNEGAALRGARCMIEVGKQAEGEYTEVKRVYDVNGNEPGKAPAQPQQATQTFTQAPQQQQPQPGPAFAPAQAPQQPPANAWGGQPAQQQPQTAQPTQQASWMQGGAAPQQEASAGAPTPPWAK